MFAGAGLRVEIEHEPRQPRRNGCPEVLYRQQAERSGRQVYRGGARPFWLGRKLLTGCTCCRNGVVGMKRIEGKTWEGEEADQEGDGEDAPQD